MKKKIKVTGKNEKNPLVKSSLSSDLKEEKKDHSEISSTSSDPLKSLAFTTKVKQLFSWHDNGVNPETLLPLMVGSSCCSMEMMTLLGPHYNPSINYSLHSLNFTPEESDLLIVSGTINDKILPMVKLLYQEMKRPNYVIAIGSCAISGGPFDSYSVIPGISKFIPVDIQIPGCPPVPEAIDFGIKSLKKVVEKRNSEEKGIHVPKDSQINLDHKRNSQWSL